MTSTNAKDWLHLKRIVRFGDTDAAGVMHFHQLFRWSHEAWEESLEIYGISISDVFPKYNQEDDVLLQVALPIVHCEADFRLAVVTGDHLDVVIAPYRIDSGTFQVFTTFKRQGEQVGSCLLRHCSINVSTRKRCALPEAIDLWLEASLLNLGPRPL